MINLLHSISNILQWAGSFIIVLFVLNNYRHHKKPIIILGIMGGLSVIFQFLQSVVNKYLLGFQFANMIGDTYSYLESLVFLLFYYQFFKEKEYFKIGLAIFILLNSIFYFLSVFGDPDYPWYAMLHSARDFELMVLSALLFLNLPYEAPYTLPRPVFWINAAILSYFSCTFILSLSMDYIATTLKDDFVLFWTFRNFLRAGFCIVLCIGIWKASKQLTLTLPKNTIS